MATVQMQMYDPSRELALHNDELVNAVTTVIQKGDFIGGAKVKQLEEVLQQYTNSKHAITCANGTDALFIALKALNIGPGDKVLTVSLTWISSAETISMTGAEPVWIDVKYDTFCMDETLIEQSIDANVKAIVVVSLYGIIPNYEEIYRIANLHGLYVIEDGAQSFGAIRNGYKSCSNKYTHIATTSFFPTKPLGCFGDGGCMFTNDDELANKMRAIKSHGGIERFKHKYIGVNSRLDTIQASVLLEKMKWLDESLTLRDNCAISYSQRLSLLPYITVPCHDIDRHVWAQYSLLTDTEDKRNQIVKALKDNGVNVAIFYPVPLHKQECFCVSKDFTLPITENICSRIFNLPCYSYVTDSEIEKICNIIENC